MERQRRKADADDAAATTPDPVWRRKGMIVVVCIILGWVYVGESTLSWPKWSLWR